MAYNQEGNATSDIITITVNGEIQFNLNFLDNSKMKQLYVRNLIISENKGRCYFIKMHIGNFR